ncbi:MAG: DNA-3-methyladenine glycosylase [Roseburia sp.]|nr:DNA-3-methyladenine glycosylase [Roseburia sp.]MCM1278362.1 DNA-3-methyladenine glycosylase [Robinsoniella sp.]
MGKLPRDFYTRGTLEVAKDLLGKILVHETPEGITKGKIVEVEAYCGVSDKGAHAYGGLRTDRTEIMFGPGGFSYVYLIYGMHSCMNIVTEKKEVPECVFLRALEPVEGIELMKKRRKTDKLKNLCNGPGKLCQAMGIDRSCYGLDLLGGQLYVEEPERGGEKSKRQETDLEKSGKKSLRQEANPVEIVASKRINIDYAQEAKDFLWRFSIKGNPFVSAKV